MLSKVLKSLIATLVVAGAPTLANAQGKSTLEQVKARGQLSCGVNVGLPGFSSKDDKGAWSGLDADYCRAIAAAVLGDANKVKFTATTTKERFTALNSGELDVLARNTTWTLQRDSAQGLSFVGVNYYDGQGFMVKKSAGLKSAKELDGATICVQTGTTTELNLADFFRDSGLKYKPLVFEKADEAMNAYQSNRCDSFTTDVSGLYAQKLITQNPDEHVVLPDFISKEPLGPSVRQGDSQWFSIVKWVHYALLNAEEAGITQKNVDEKLGSTNADVKRILGKDGDFGKGLGLDNDWVVRIIKQVGNYGEIFDRNVGAGSRLKIDRGFNRLWKEGGLHYAPPIR
jgi:general L-amino acid transport system substrate-binding protein